MKKYTIECTKCNNVITQTAEEAVNATRNEDVKKRVIMKRVFEARCPKCQNIHFVTRPFLYQDDERRALYVLASEGMDVDRFVKKQNLKGNYKKQYSLRVVRSINQLVEKILLVENNINDKAIEVLKLFFVMGEKNSNIRNVYFEELEGNRIRLAVIMADGRQLTAYADVKGLERIVSINKKALNEKKHEWEEVNVKWAMDFYNANEAEINRIGALVEEQTKRENEALKKLLEERKAKVEEKKPTAKKTTTKKTETKKTEKKEPKKTTKKTAEKKVAEKKVAEKETKKTTEKKSTKKATITETKKTTKKTDK